MKLKLVDKKKEAQGTKSFVFEPEKKVNYLPGQYFYFTLPKLTHKDPRGPTRHFTLSLSPTEGNIIRLTTRMRKDSGYKKTLDELKMGSEIEGEGPNGTFILDEKEKGSHVFLTGGIGITPIRSFIKYNLDKSLKSPLHLIYANSKVGQITFRKDLEGWAEKNDNIKVDMTISRPEGSKKPWKGLTGRIDENLLRKLITDIREPIYWVCGPPGMVDAMEKVLGKLKITSDRIRSEKFTGY